MYTAWRGETWRHLFREKNKTIFLVEIEYHFSVQYSIKILLLGLYQIYETLTYSEMITLYRFSIRGLSNTTIFLYSATFISKLLGTKQPGSTLFEAFFLNIKSLI